MLNAKAKGTRAERELIAHALNEGVHSVRAAASRGAYDVAITTGEGRRYLVNVKCNCWAPPIERTRLYRLARFPDIPVLARKDDRKGWRYRLLGPGGDMEEITDLPPWA